MSRKPPVPLPESDDPYVLLEVRPGASVEQIRRAYLRKVRVYKPDRHPAEFRRVREAYDRLREQERWFDAWRQASEVVRKAAEEAARAEGEASDDGGDDAAAQAGDEAQDDEGAREGHGYEHEHEDDGEDDDVEALIAALEEELREAREAGEELDDDELGDDADEDRGMNGRDHGPWRVVPIDRNASLRGRASTNASAERLDALEQQVHAALEADRLVDAAALLLAPDADVLAAQPRFATLLLEVCCAVVWEDPPQLQALVGRYGDVISQHDTEHRDGALLHRRILADELPAWRRVVADWPELHRFVVLGSSLRAPGEAELGLRLGKRAAADPTAFLRVLVVASACAPGIVALYCGMAERWSRAYGTIALHPDPRTRPTVDRAAAALADSVLHHRWVRWEQLWPLLVGTTLVTLLLTARSPLVELVVIGAVLVLWAWRAWMAAPEVRIFGRVLRPAAAAWLWATHASLDDLATALRDHLPPPGTWAAVLHPGTVAEYPERLAGDLALLAFGVTAPMIPLLRSPGDERGSGSGAT